MTETRDTVRASRAARAAALVYGWLAYFLYVRTALYLVGFVGNLYVSKGVDGGAAGLPWVAGATDVGLLVLFAVPHSLLARPRFKRWLGRWLPAELERSSYVLIASVSLALLMWLWRPLPALLWDVGQGWQRNAVLGLFFAGWVLSLVASKTLGHFRLFGLRSAWAFARGRPAPQPVLVTRGLYGFVRHPMYLGFVVGCWATPRMTAGHLLFALALTAYTALGARFEERDLERRFGDELRAYRQQVGGFFPRPSRPATRPATSTP